MNPWTVACQAPLSIEFSRPKHWSSKHKPEGEEEGIEYVSCDNLGWKEKEDIGKRR